MKMPGGACSVAPNMGADQADDRILLFIPCYNCAPQIGRVLASVKGTIATHFAEVLVLDNGSADGTIDAAIAAASQIDGPVVTVARNDANFNLGGSHKAAYSYAAAHGFTHVVTLHGDDQGDLNDLLPVLVAGDHRRADACMGARFAKGSRLKNYSAFRIVGNRVFNLFFSMASGRWVTDMGSGLNLLAKRAFADSALMRLPDDLHFNPYLLLDMFDRKQRVRFFPISWREEDQVSNVRMTSQALKTLGAAVRYAFARKAFRSGDFRKTLRDDYGFSPVMTFAGRSRAD
jgi:dolichol-phosphate mannosyltransferase